MISGLRFDDRGLVPVVVQDADTRQVLMLAYANDEALEATVESGQVHFFSRSRDRLWRKGETSGNVLELVEMRADCDGDALLALARPAGPACHRGTTSCFGDGAEPEQGLGFLEELWAVVAERAHLRPPGSYTAVLLAAGVEAAAGKVTEEAGELAEAARSESPERVAEEAADLLYHLLVLLASRGLEPRAAVEALQRRR